MSRHSELQFDLDASERLAYRKVCAALVSASNYHDSVTWPGYIPTHEQIYCYNELRENLHDAKVLLEEALTNGTESRKS